MQKIQLFRFAVILLSITIAVIYSTSHLSNEKREVPKVSDGVIDLSNWSFVEDGSLHLYGEWEFYWNEHLSPNSRGESKANKSLIKVPEQWSSQDNLSSKGIATYKLKINNMPEGTDYGMEIYKIPSSYNLFINGKLLGSSGVVGKNQSEEQPQYGPKYFTFHLDNLDTVEIVIQTSNFHYRSGGIRGVIQLGASEQILASKEEKISFQLAMVGGLLLLGLYHLGLFIYRRKEYSALFFGLLCLSMALRTSLVGESYFTHIFPNFPWILQIKLLYLSLYALLPFFIWFFYHLVKEQLSLKITNIISAISLMFCLIVLVTPVDFFTKTMKFFYVYILLLIIYFMAQIIKAVGKGKPGFMFLSISGVFLSYAVVRDIIFYRKEMQNGELTSLGIFIFVVGLALVNSARLAQTFTKIEQAQVKLQQWNEQLEMKVAERTQELMQANKRLEQLSFLDGLTNIPNRRLFDKAYKEAWDKASKEKKELALLMIDIDNFKQLNDKYGHLFGDECLKNVAKLLEEQANAAGKLVARYGGEEFVIILNDVSLDEAELFARNCLKAVQTINKIESDSINLTVSIGVGSIIPSDKDEELLIAKADKALYAAKKHGKNRVVVYSNLDGRHQEGSNE